MAGTINPEDAINGIISVLGADLPAKLNTLDTEYTDSIVLDDVAKFYRAPLERYDVYPCAVVVCRRVARPESLANESIWYLQIEIQVMVVGNATLAAYQSVTLLPQELVAIRLSRTCRGIEEVLNSNPHIPISATHYAEHIRVENVEYSDFTQEGGGFLRAAQILTEVIVGP